MLWPVMTQAELTPFSELRRLQRDMNRLFEEGAASGEPFPAVNIWSNAERIAITAELPGVDPKDLGLSTLGDQLTIEGEVKPEDADKEATWHRQERASGKFIRTFRLPFEVDASKVSARSRNGVLQIVLPRAEESKPKKIAVSGD